MDERGGTREKALPPSDRFRRARMPRGRTRGRGALRPASSQAQSATPNVIFGIDDSGSMDFEVMLPTVDGALWWDTANKRFWNASGTFNTNVGSGASASALKYAYLFPNGGASDARQLLDDVSSFAHFAIPPIPAYAALRSATYNPLYYNPAVDYAAWAPAYIASGLRTFANATATAARSRAWPCR